MSNSIFTVASGLFAGLSFVTRLEGTNKKNVKKHAETYGWKIVDMGEVYENYDSLRIRLSKKDNHPTAFAYRLIAEELEPAVKSCIRKE